MHPAIIRVTPAVKFILILNCLVYVGQLVFQKLLGSTLIESWLALVCKLSYIWQLWRFVSYAFLHTSVWSLLLSILALLLIGPALEGYLGKLKFLHVYFGSVICGGLASYVVAQFVPEPVVVVGGSAGIFGILACFAILNPEACFNVWLLLIIPIKAIYVWCITASFLVICMLDGPGMGWWPANDLGGFVFGTCIWLSQTDVGRSLKARYSRWKAWRRIKFSRLKAMRSSGSTILNKDNQDSKRCISLKLLPNSQTFHNSESSKAASNPDELKLNALMDKLTLEGAKCLTEEERAFLKSKSKRN
ncbi:MAG: rhomboid family intramembrane serine protease [Candidatus Bruticola sp.]